MPSNKQNNYAPSAQDAAFRCACFKQSVQTADFQGVADLYPMC